MLRDVDINDISDGNLYKNSDMVRIACNDCKGCSECCHDMGDSICLDPYDIYILEKGLNLTFNELMDNALDMHQDSGIILPHIKMQENNACIYLNSEGRCSIHNIRPGFCRLFPLGRIYEGDSFMYFNQIYECSYKSKSKVKIKKWLGIDNLGEYERFIISWHGLQKKMINCIADEDEAYIKALNTSMLKTFYINPYDANTDFYCQYYDRLNTFNNILN